MSDADDPLEAAQTAVFNLAEDLKRRAARRLVHRLQRISTSGIYGDDYRRRSLWDELCHEQQNGPYFDKDVWDETLKGLLQAEVERLTPGEFGIVWLASVPEVEDLKTAPRVQAGIRRELRADLEAFASRSDLERFEVW